MIKEYADRIREEIKKAEKEIDQIASEIHTEGLGAIGRLQRKIRSLEDHKDGLNKALDIYLDLVKEDL